MDFRLLTVSTEFWKWLGGAMNYERALGCAEHEIEGRKNYLMRTYLYMAPPAGYC